MGVFDVGTHNGFTYLVTELLEGEELRERLNRGPLPQHKAIDFDQQIVAGLAAAHEKGIVHRDLKPENLFVTTNDRVKILDFGLAKLRPQRSEVISSEIATAKQITDPGTVMGTVGYVSPEQVRGQNADLRSDIFSFGAILYEMLAGQRAIRRETVEGDHTPQMFVQGPFNAGGARFSPEGHWVAYVSDESGNNEVNVRPYPDGTRVQISATGGTPPVGPAMGASSSFATVMDYLP